MASLTRSLLRAGVDFARRNKIIQQIFESPIDISKMKQMGEFTDSRGNKHVLYEELRSKVKPGWRKVETALRTESSVPEFDKDQKTQKKRVQSGKIAAQKILPLINSLKGDLSKLHILEIGCHSGATSFAMAEAGVGRITGSDSALHKINSTIGSSAEEIDLSVNLVNKALAEVRVLVGNHFNNSNRVSFADDDICMSQLPDNSFDVICSWDVIEHLHDPTMAFRHMWRMLKPGGITIHDYNPFYSLNGGHSFCTTDFLWGHVRLSNADFDRYADEWRTDIKDISKSFFRHGLNRMSASDFKSGTAESGLELLAMMPFTREQHVLMMNKEILDQAMAIHPNITMADLVTPRYISIQQKPI